jgi:two-component system, cell cycle sensor histidine kinase and response regulator CckA
MFGAPHSSAHEVLMTSDDADASAGGSKTILVVEDEEIQRRSVVRLLVQLGYQVLEAANGAEALAALNGVTSPVHLVLTDVQMPGMGGAQLAALLAGRRPRIPVLFMTAFVGEDTLWPADETGPRRWLLKPFAPDELAEAVRQAMHGAV